MASAFLRLLLISLLSIILGVLAVFSVRWLGSKQVFAPPPHPWYKRDFWWVFVPPLEEICAQGGKLDARPSWVLSIPVAPYAEGWAIPCGEKPLPIAEVLAASSHEDWLIRLQAKDKEGLDRFLNDVGAFDARKKFAVYTSSQRAARFLRKKAPQWLFAADTASLLRFQIFSNLWIETAMDFWPDFVIVPQTGFPALTAREVEELKRRHKRIIWNAIEDTSAARPAYIDGVMTSRPGEVN